MLKVKGEWLQGRDERDFLFRKHSVHDVGLPMDGCVRMKTFSALVTLS